MKFSRSRTDRIGLVRSGRLALGLIVAAALAGGCSDGSQVPKVADTGNHSGGSSASNSPTKADVLAYAKCMRSHGVANFPDPDASGKIKIESGRDKDGNVTGVDVNSPQFKSAQAACGSLRKAIEPGPQERAKVRAAALKFAACMRSHGVPKFPDPEPDGGQRLDAGPRSGIDPDSPQFKAAEQACKRYESEADHGAHKGVDGDGRS